MIKIPFFTNKYQDKRYGAEIRKKIDEIIKTGIFILGEEVKKFEENLKNYTQAKYVIGVANGSDALYLSVQALDILENSEIITTPFTFFSSVSCITRNNLKPVFIDVNEATYNINVDEIENHITNKTSCILPVDLFCQMPDYDRINNISEKYNLKIIEDSAEAFGMKWKDKYAGLCGDAGIYSFFPTKTLSCFGDGGAVITNNDMIADKIRILRTHGAQKKYFHKYTGINSRLDELQAGILNVKLKYINEEIHERGKIAKIYSDKLRNSDKIKLPGIGEGASPVWYVYSIQCERRDALKEFLFKNGIETSVYYPLPLHLQECFKNLGYKKGDFPVSEKLCETSLALPVFIGMNEEMIDYVCDRIIEFYE